MNQPWVYIVLIGLIIIVYAKIMPRTNGSKELQGPTIGEIEETMEHFAAELEEQNEALIRQLAETTREYDAQSAKLASKIDMLEKQSVHTGQEIARLSLANEELQKKLERITEWQQSVLQNAAAFPQPSGEAAAAVEEPQASQGMNIKKRYSELFSMYDQGKSSDYIAKKMGMNKGEVSLIIQLAKQEEQLNVQK
ncbi:hypothetical protein N0M98_17155 [Paenibacillus doosanensis]|uniref:hypothetical protein n=1 Tax=Paenibacillus doosanensis TaxID=1229154 RepID=UPI00217F8B69|nr:hypothetical protein [Paenibacillus doosanensis]MCS7461867.1 hypothetical protein [Paenibacillus doosanensis]